MFPRMMQVSNWLIYFTRLIGDFTHYTLTPILIKIIELNIVPDFILRQGIRFVVGGGLAFMKSQTTEKLTTMTREFVLELKTMPIALEQEKANEQHYEVPDEFFQRCLGPYMKYSSGYWPSKDTTLEESEVHMLEMYAERAELFDGMSLLDVGCGWGSVTLFVAEKYPRAKITSISNSHSQREYITQTALKKGLKNITVFTGDMASFQLPESYAKSFDRVISIEMFEHCKNYEKLLEKISGWMKKGAKLFVHIFTQKGAPQHFETGWMAETFFTGGSMPSDTLLLNFQKDVTIAKQWSVNGKHYQRTLEAWLCKLDQQKRVVMPILKESYGNDDYLATKWFVNWRLFYMGCAEFFGYADGEEYFVSHYLFESR